MATIKQIKDSAGTTHDIVDTKNTAGSTNSSSKLYLIGATSQAANPQTYSHDTTYVGTDGCLYSNSQKVITVSDTVTTTTNGIMSARDKAKLDGIATNANNYSLPTAKYNTLGGLKPAYTSTGSATLTTTSASNTNTPTISSKSTEEGRYFAVEADANGIPYVNVPEATHRFSYTITSSSGLSSAAALTYVSGSGTYNAGSIIRIDFNGNVGLYCQASHWFKYTKNGLQYNFKVGRFSSDGTFIDASDDVSGIATGNISTFFTKSFALFRVISITSATTDAQKILMTPIYYSSLGQLSSNSIVSENINVCPNGDNSSYNLLFTSNITTDASEYKTLYTDSDNSLSYNPSTNILNVPSIISSSSCSFGSNTNVKSIFNIKGSNHSSDVISLVGNSSTVAPYVSIRSAGSSTEGIRLSGSKSSSAPYISIKTAGSATESIKLTGRTSTAAPSISIKSAGTSTTPTEGIKLTGSTSSAAPSILINTAGKDDVGIKLIGCANNTPAYITVYSTDGKYTNITGGSAPYTSSDERLKNFKDDVEVDFDKLKQIPKKYFTWKDGDQTKLEMGTSAQEVEKLYPNIVQEIDGYKSIEYAKLSIIALAAIDKLNERIEYLENKLKELE